MARSSKLYKVDDGFIGDIDKVAEHLGATNNAIYEGVRLKRKVKHHFISVIGNTTQQYEVYKGEELIMTGSVKEISNKMYISESALRSAIRKKSKLLGEYEIKEKR